MVRKPIRAAADLPEIVVACAAHDLYSQIADDKPYRGLWPFGVEVLHDLACEGLNVVNGIGKLPRTIFAGKLSAKACELFTQTENLLL